MMITLSDQKPFATGTTRRCYVHPHDPDKCIKILIPGVKGHNLTQPNHPHRSLYFLRRFSKYLSDANLKEWRGYLHARTLREEWVRNYIPRCYDFVETDLGLGLVVDLLRHDNGDIAPSLGQRLQSGADDSFWTAWAEYKEFILQSGYFPTELGNVLSVRRNGKEHLYFAECKYKRPWLKQLPYIRHKRLLWKIAELEKKINHAIVGMRKNDDIINLADTTPFAKGKTRQCYVHPDNPDICIKVLIPGAKGYEPTLRQRRPLYFLRRFFRPVSNANLNEWRGYLNAHAMRKEWVWDHLPRCYDFAETDLGLGLAVELLRHDNGDIATPLDRRLQAGVDDSFREAWTEFKRFILRSGYFSTTLPNIVCVRQNGKERLYLAECDRLYRRLWLALLPYIVRPLLHWRIARLEKRINHAIAP